VKRLFGNIKKTPALLTAGGALIGLMMTSPAAQAATTSDGGARTAAAYCTQTVNPDLIGGYSYCVGITGSHRVAIYCEHIFAGRWVYGPWKPSGHESHANCGWGEYVTQIFTQ
jgi:hypothetical protein